MEHNTQTTVDPVVTPTDIDLEIATLMHSLCAAIRGSSEEVRQAVRSLVVRTEIFASAPTESFAVLFAGVRAAADDCGRRLDAAMAKELDAGYLIEEVRERELDDAFRQDALDNLSTEDLLDLLDADHCATQQYLDSIDDCDLWDEIDDKGEVIKEHVRGLSPSEVHGLLAELDMDVSTEEWFSAGAIEPEHAVGWLIDHARFEALEECSAERRAELLALLLRVDPSRQAVPLTLHWLRSMDASENFLSLVGYMEDDRGMVVHGGPVATITRGVGQYVLHMHPRSGVDCTCAGNEVAELQELALAVVRGREE